VRLRSATRLRSILDLFQLERRERSSFRASAACFALGGVGPAVQPVATALDRMHKLDSVAYLVDLTLLSSQLK